MASLWWWGESLNHALLERCRREVRAQMVASGFQIGQKFDAVAERRARKLYNARSYYL